ncbi:MAG: hypothetical protein H6702_15720 [Myxococcales bacterium]|nr:hypothetical protein [Myxococcales bacterium]
MTPAKTLDEVLARLDVLIDEGAARGSTAGLFPALYRSVTAGVKAGIEAERFDDGPRMARFDIDFANRFFAVQAAWQAGQPTPRAWRVALQALDDPQVGDLQHLLLGMNAHINFDLPQAAEATCPGPGLPALARDFERINDLLEGMIDDAQAIVWGDVPGLRLADRLLGGLDEALVNFSIRRARAAAWGAARLLAVTPGGLRDELTTLMDRQVGWLGERIRDGRGPWVGHNADRGAVIRRLARLG